MNKEELVDKIVREWSYRCEKGYPELTSKRDLEILNNLFSIDLLEDIRKDTVLEGALSNTAKAIEKLIKDYGDQYNFKNLSDKRRISSPNPLYSKPEFFVELLKKAFQVDNVEVLEPNEKENPSSSFRMYKTYTDEFGDIEIILSTNLPGGHGVQSEKNFYTNVKKYIEEYGSINILLKSDNRVESFKDITEVVDTSKLSTKEGEKSDMRFYSGKEVIANLSLKKDGPFRWASVKGMFSDFVKGFFEKGFSEDSTFPILLRKNPKDPTKFLMYDRKVPTNRITKVIVENIPDDYEETIIFGPEEPKPLIVGRSFSDKDFTFNTETTTLQVSVSDILKDMDEIVEKGLQPIFVINQHIRRKYGIEFRIFAKKYGGDPGEKARYITIDYNQAF